MRRYAIIPTSDVDNTVMSFVIEQSQSDIRTTVTGVSMSLIRWDISTPAIFSGYTIYTHPEILSILNDVNGNWFVDTNTI